MIAKTRHRLSRLTLLPTVGDLAQIWQRVAGRDLMPEKGGP
jgi:hypothetical protein